MSELDTTADSGAGAAAPAELQTQDAITPAVADPAAQTPDPAAEEAKQAEEKRKNRTREYIQRLNRENAELRAWRAQQEQAAQAQPRTPPQASPDRPPQLEDFAYDMTAWQEANAQWAFAQARRGLSEETQQAEYARQQQQTLAAYYQRAAEFAEARPDFEAVVGSIQYPLHDALQAAIAAHPKGPELAYHLGLNDDDAFQLASIQPHLAAAAVERLAARLSAAPAAKQPTAPTPRPITQAPAPVPTVGGRSPTEVPEEKLTDEQWLARERERDRSRRKA